MQSIKPLSAVTPVATTQAIFPFLQHAFLPAGIVGNDNTDVVGGVIVTDASGWAQPEAGKFRAAGIIQTVSGSAFVAPGLSDFMLISVGNANSAGITVSLGDAADSGPGVSLASGATNLVTLNATDYHTVAALSDTTSVTAMAVTRTGNTVAKYGCDDATAPFAAAAGTPLGAGIAASWGALSANAAFTSNSSSWYTGVYFCVFTSGLPAAADIKLALTWMSMNPGYLPPWWAGKE